jgi:uncharacterized protein (TIGR02996 family)
MTQDEAFLQDIVAHPEDNSLRLIYADWLDEQGDPRAGFLRLEAEFAALPETDRRKKRLRKRLRKLQKDLPSDWLVRLDRTAIENCEVRFEFQCPKRWEKLQATGDEKVRYCDTCCKPVFHCDTVAQAQEHAWEGECVAIDSRVVRKEGDLHAGLLPMLLGRMTWTRPPRRERRVSGTVTIRAGSFSGMQAEVEEVLPGERVRVRLVLFGRPVTLDLNFYDVEPQTQVDG